MYLSTLPDIGNSNFYEKLKTVESSDKTKIKSYFKQIDFDNIDEVDLSILPVIALIEKQVEDIAKGIYATKGINEQEAKKFILPKYRQIKTELYNILCTESEDYEKIRKTTYSAIDALIAGISNAIIDLTGIGYDIVMTVIAFLLKAIFRIGKEIWCSLQK